MPSASGDVAEDIRALVEATRTMFDRPEVRIALPALIADTVADPDVHSTMIVAIRRAASPPSGPGSTSPTRRDDGDLPLLAEVVVGSAIFRILVRHDAPLDAAWVDDLTALISSGWTATKRGSSAR